MKTAPMNERLTSASIRVSMTLLIATGLLLFALTTQSSDLRREDGGAGKLEGVWNVTVNICNNGPTVTRMNTFMFGGTMQEIAAFVSPPLSAPRGPGHGIWAHSTDGHYSYTLKFFVFNADGTLAGWRIEMRDVTVDIAGNSYTATGTSQLYDINGNPVGTPLCATESGTRFQ